MEIITEIYLSDLADDTKDQLMENIMDRVANDKDEMEIIEKKIDKEIEEDGEFMDLVKLTRKDRIEMEIEDRADEILKKYFYGEINISY